MSQGFKPPLRPFVMSDELSPPSWTVAWSDLMMVMFILFVVLYVYAAKYRTVPEMYRPSEVLLDSDRTLSEEQLVLGHSADEPVQVNLEQVRRRLSERLAMYEPHVTVKGEDGHGVVVSLHGRVFFPAGSARPTELALRALDDISEGLIATKSFVTVTAYADEAALAGSEFESPLELAALRAARAAARFTRVKGLEPERFVAQGFALQPLVPADSAIDRERNERLEIWLTGQYR